MAKIKIKRPGKGDSLFKFLTDYTVVDLETTGLDPINDTIIEIGAIRIRNGIEEARFSELVNPGRSIPEFITELTGISDDMIRNARQTNEVIADFLDFLGDDVILGHNVNFDVNFLYDTCVREHMPVVTNNFVDTMRISRKVLPKLPHHRLSDLADHYGLVNAGAHRAVNDCEVTHLAYREMCIETAKQQP